jgi:hypothetical protein
MTAFLRNHALVIKERIASSLDFNPELLKSSGQPIQERFWFQSRCIQGKAFSTQFTGISICHPRYDDKHNLRLMLWIPPLKQKNFFYSIYWLA